MERWHLPRYLNHGLGFGGYKEGAMKVYNNSLVNISYYHKNQGHATVHWNYKGQLWKLIEN